MPVLLLVIQSVCRKAILIEKQKIKKLDCSDRPESLGPCASQIVKNKTSLVLICQNIDAMRILK